MEGFTSEIPYYMHLSDFFIGKPGPGSISEALAMQLPVIVERNAWTLPQERYNTEWIREKQVGVVLKSFRDIDAGLRRTPRSGELRSLSSQRRGDQESRGVRDSRYSRLLAAAMKPVSPIASPAQQQRPVERIRHAARHGIAEIPNEREHDDQCAR